MVWAMIGVGHDWRGTFRAHQLQPAGFIQRLQAVQARHIDIYQHHLKTRKITRNLDIYILLLCNTSFSRTESVSSVIGFDKYPLTPLLKQTLRGYRITSAVTAIMGTSA